MTNALWEKFSQLEAEIWDLCDENDRRAQHIQQKFYELWAEYKESGDNPHESFLDIKVE